MYATTAEFLGTFLLVAVIAFVGNPYAVGAALAAGMVLVGGISGGHFNPAVSLWAYISGKISSGTLSSYIIAQSAAAISVFLLKRIV
jgi:aquaporin Z